MPRSAIDRQCNDLAETEGHEPAHERSDENKKQKKPETTKKNHWSAFHCLLQKNLRPSTANFRAAQGESTKDGCSIEPSKRGERMPTKKMEKKLKGCSSTRMRPK